MRPRSGFTLVEMMVAMALTMFIMVILTQAFVTSIDVFSQLKAIGDMEETLRTATNLLVDDLKQDHFEGRRRLSDWTMTVPASRPREGFFHIRMPTAASLVVTQPYYIEGNDTESPPIQSRRATNHMFHFTNKHRGNRPGDIVTAVVPAGSPLLMLPTNFFNQPSDSLFQEPGSNLFSSQWEEVAWWLQRTGTTQNAADTASAAAVGRTPLFTLWRNQHVIVPDPAAVTAAAIPVVVGQYDNFCCRNVGGIWDFTSPADLTVSAPAAQVKRTFSPAAPTTRGATQVLSNVISFQVQVMKERSGNISGVSGSTVTTSANHGFTLNNVPVSVTISSVNGMVGASGTFVGSATANNTFLLPTMSTVGTYVANTGSWTARGLDFEDVGPNGGAGNFESATTNFQIRAVQITIRIWDPKTQQSRQVTVRQDM